MSNAVSDAQPSILDVLEDAIDCVLFGSGGVFLVPKDGYVESRWLNKKECFRVTIDLAIAPPEKRGPKEGIGARRVERWESQRRESA